MGGMKDHYLGDTPYPASPGYKRHGTSRDAARRVGARALPQRKQALLDAILAAPDGLTADEAAAKGGESPLYARPRVAELAATGKVVDSGRRRRNASGLDAIVWRRP